jgi:PAS domain S-box-containing protein
MIVDSAPVGIVLMDHNGLIVMANTSFQQMLGYSAVELRTRHYEGHHAPR